MITTTEPPAPPRPPSAPLKGAGELAATIRAAPALADRHEPRRTFPTCRHGSVGHHRHVAASPTAAAISRWERRGTCQGLTAFAAGADLVDAGPDAEYRLAAVKRQTRVDPGRSVAAAWIELIMRSCAIGTTVDDGDTWDSPYRHNRGRQAMNLNVCSIGDTDTAREIAGTNDVQTSNALRVRRRRGDKRDCQCNSDRAELSVDGSDGLLSARRHGTRRLCEWGIDAGHPIGSDIIERLLLRS